ncbi:hypothetical protein I551_8988 [Mycobacterium ulcerans str. Harvey]|uniref:Uncharacterized protein n=1 Tax=Mycobacterium ulcerans str. Harvey TaxID=1299332 RepID=A0ABN0R9J6_MYCUL|nr:hypothetical protein I551_8988 [Mycobacterium ulcerans str. Harvey]
MVGVGHWMGSLGVGLCAGPVDVGLGWSTCKVAGKVAW